MKGMKIRLAVLLLSLGVIAPAAAQKFQWGLTGGLNLSKMKVSGDLETVRQFDSANRTGWYIGPKVAFSTILGIGFDAAVEYSQRDLEINNETEAYRTLEIPINLRYNIGLGDAAAIYVATGPQFGFALKNMAWSQTVATNFSKNNVNTTWNVGAGVRLLKHLEVGLGYNFAIGKVGKAIVPTGDSRDVELEYKANTFQVQVAYLF